MDRFFRFVGKVTTLLVGLFIGFVLGGAYVAESIKEQLVQEQRASDFKQFTEQFNQREKARG